MQDTAFTVWQNISGSGMLLALYACAEMFLFFREKEAYKRVVLVYLPLFWTVLLLLPFTYELVAGVVDEELYYRFFWMLPVSLVIAYAMVVLYHDYHGRRRGLLAVCMAMVIILGGDFVYNNWRLSKAENPYHVPQTVVELCDLMHTEGREVLAVFPSELLQYVRQYDSTICLLYGRNVLVEGWKIEHPLYELMEAETIDGAVLGEQALAYRCVYIVLRAEQDMTGDLSAYGYAYKGSVGEYLVYYNDALFREI